MNFEEAFKHCQEGTATEEEKQFVKQQLDAANSFLDNQPEVEEAPIKEAEKKDVKKFKKRLKKLILTPVLVVLSIVFIAGTVLAGVFGYSASCASKQVEYDRFECADIAKQEAYNYIANAVSADLGSRLDDSMFRIEDIDRRFIYDQRELGASFYVYQVEIDWEDVEFEIEIDTRTGKIRDLRVEGIAAYYRI